MSWQRSIQTAIRTLKKEESALRQQLAALQAKITELERVARTGGTVQKQTTRRLSPKGRAAISKAAKRRWAQYRAEQRRKQR
jgi:molybdopterin-biosynthesis enzyme MoeA-like protein